MYTCKKKRLNLFGRCVYLKENGACKKPDELMCRELYPDPDVSSININEKEEIHDRRKRMGCNSEHK